MGAVVPYQQAAQVRVLGEPFVVEAIGSVLRAIPELQVLAESQTKPNHRDSGVRRYLTVRIRPAPLPHIAADERGFL